MTNEDTAIAAQMREWLEDELEWWTNKRGPLPIKTDVAAHASEHIQELGRVITHLDTLTSKRWRVVETLSVNDDDEIETLEGEAQVSYQAACNERGWDIELYNLPMNARVMIVTEEE